VAEYHFYGALARSAACDSAAADARSAHLEALLAHQKQQEIWKEHCPANFASRTALVGAEIARIEARVLEAEQLYEGAIRAARSDGFVNVEALSYELAARFYAARGFERFADAYLIESRYCYRRWGAEGKVTQMEESYPQLKRERQATTAGGTVFAPVELLDVATVIKVSQAVSGQIGSDGLIDSIMHTAIEHAGADGGALLVPRGDDLWVKAEVSAREGEVAVRQPDTPMSSAALPSSLLRYVMRTQESVILDDASSENPFSSDPYVSRCRPRSILALPLTKQGGLVSILYLENRLAPHVFTAGRIATLRVLASEAAIALENSRLYREVANREAKFRRLFDANIIGIFIWNLEGKITGCNKAFLDMVMYDEQDVAAGLLQWTTLTPREWSEHDERALAQANESGIVPQYEKEYWRKDGTRVPVLVAGALFEEGGGEGVGFALDLSEQKRAEEGRKQTTEALIVAHEKLARAAQSATLGELAASIAHEINQPLAAVVANGDACVRWLHAAPANVERARVAAERIVRDGRSAAEFVRKIRGLFKHATPEKEVLDIEEVVAEVIRVMRDELAGRCADMRVRFDSGLPRICADRIQIQQVVINLVRNALDACEQGLDGGGKVVEIYGRLEGQGSVTIEVLDHGCGIEDPEKVFVPFFTTKKAGMGVGLSICRSIVEAHGGRLRAARNKDRGSRFIVSLPANNARSESKGPAGL